MRISELKPVVAGALRTADKEVRAVHTSSMRIGERLNYVADVKRELSERGFAYVNGTGLRVPSPLRPALRALLSECADLPADKYCPDRTRDRRHSRLILLPWENRIMLWPKSSYFQDAAVNQADGGITRRFDPLTPSMLRNKFLQQLILADFRQTSFDETDMQQPFDVGVHIIKMRPRAGKAAIASPNRLHKDTEPYTFVHLLERQNVAGGESVVADNDKNPLFITTLSAPLETIVVRDEAVFHHVMPIMLANTAAPGHRTTLLIDFTPMRSAVNVYT